MIDNRVIRSNCGTCLKDGVVAKESEGVPSACYGPLNHLLLPGIEAVGFEIVDARHAHLKDPEKLILKH